VARWRPALFTPAERPNGRRRKCGEAERRGCAALASEGLYASA